MWEVDYKESWAPKNWCFWTVVLEKTLKSPLDCKEIKPVGPEEISPEYSLEGLMLKLQYFGHLMRRTDSLEKTLMPGKIEGRRRRGRRDEMIGWHHWLNGHEFEVNSGNWCWTRKPVVLWFMGSQRVGHDWATELNWSKGNLIKLWHFCTTKETINKTKR